MIVGSNMWRGISQSVIAASAGLLGVSIGGWITATNQKRERRNARIRQQLDGFYSPMLGMHAEIDAKSRLRLELHSVSRRVWENLFVGYDAETKARIRDERWGAFQKVLEYSDDQLRAELVPLYEKMLEHFSTNMWLAEPSTIGH